jgi:hypothetical protein
MDGTVVLEVLVSQSDRYDRKNKSAQIESDKVKYPSKWDIE